MQAKKLLTAVLTGVFLSTSVFLAGCGKKEPEVTKPGTETNQGDKIDADQTINIVGVDYSSLDPSAVSDTNSFTTLTNVFEGLTREVEKNGAVVSELAGASKMEKSADGKTYTFTIRDSKWSDGKPVTAKDYVTSWRRLNDPANAADYLTFLEEIGVKNAKAVADGKAAVDTLGVSAKDDKTFVVELEAPTAYFESALSFKCLVPQREDKIKELGKEYGSDYTKMVYNGPFVVSEYAKGSKIVYKKNEQYWDAKNIKLQTANGHIISETATIVKMFEGKELDMAGASGDNLTRLKQKAQAGEFVHLTRSAPSSFYYTFNTKSKYLSNAKIRLALSLSYDRQQQLDAVWKRFIPSYGIVPGSITTGDQEYRKAVAEPLKAVKEDPKKLLADGLKELGLPEDPSKVELKILFSQATSTSSAQAQFIQNQWQKNLGVKINIVHTPDSPSYFKERTAGNFDICAGGWGADYNDVATFFSLFISGGGNNNGKYSNKEYDDAVKLGNTTLDPKARIEAYKKAEEILLVKDAAISPYYYSDINTFKHNYLKGMYIPLLNGQFDLRNVYVQGK